MLKVCGGQPFGQESINISEWQKRATCPSVAPAQEGSLTPAEQGCHPSLGLWAARQSGPGALCWCSRTEATWGSWFCSMAFFCAGCTGEGYWGEAAATQQRGHFAPGPCPSWGISNSEQDGCQTCRIACQQQPRLRHRLFMHPLGFPVESIAAGYPLSKTY